MTQPLTVTRHQAEQGMACFPFHCTVAWAGPHLQSRNRGALCPGVHETKHCNLATNMYVAPSKQYKVIHRSIHSPAIISTVPGCGAVGSVGLRAGMTGN